MKYSSKMKIILFIISIFFVVFFQTIVYSAFSESFDIGGDAYAKLATDVRITDFKISDKYTSTNYVSNYEKFSRNSVSPSISFNGTGTVYYDVEVTNYNDNKVGLYSFSGLPEGLSVMFYDVEEVLLDGIGTKTFTICFSGTGNFEFDFIIDIRSFYNITYKDFSGSYSSTIYENEEMTINFKEDVKRVIMTVDGNEYTNFTLKDNKLVFGPVDGDVIITKKNNFLDIVSGDLDTVGSEVCIGEECFYVISSTAEKVILFGKYNLYAGGIYNGSSWKEYGTDATGVQNKDMIGWISGVTTRKGTIAFSSSAYWASGSYGSYPAYVYDSKCNSYKYLESYKSYLQSIENTVSNVRLIKYEELLSLGCTSSSCTSTYDWTYSTSYWTGSAANTSSIRMIYNNGSVYFFSYSANYNFGIRPVVEVSR